MTPRTASSNGQLPNGLAQAGTRSRTGPISTSAATGKAAPASRASSNRASSNRVSGNGVSGNGKAGPPGRTGRPGKTGSVRTAGPATAPDRSDAAAVRFTETMRGFFTFDETDPQRGYDQGRAHGTPLLFRLTLETDDVDAFVANPRHQAVANGYVECDVLGGRRPVAGGEFNLFVADDRGAAARERSTNRRMVYRLPFTDAAGHPLTLNGFKLIQDDGIVELWPDTTTLYTRIYAGHVGLGPGADPLTEPDARVVGAGILRIYPLDFLRQLTTFRADPAGPVGLAGLARFARFFVGQLQQVYVPLPG